MGKQFLNHLKHKMYLQRKRHMFRVMLNLSVTMGLAPSTSLYLIHIQVNEFRIKTIQKKNNINYKNVETFWLTENRFVTFIC